MTKLYFRQATPTRVCDKNCSIDKSHRQKYIFILSTNNPSKELRHVRSGQDQRTNRRTHSKLYGFKTTDFKGVLATRKKRRTTTAAKKVATKK